MSLCPVAVTPLYVRKLGTSDFFPLPLRLFIVLQNSLEAFLGSSSLRFVRALSHLLCLSCLNSSLMRLVLLTTSLLYLASEALCLSSSLSVHLSLIPRPPAIFSILLLDSLAIRSKNILFFLRSLIRLTNVGGKACFLIDFCLFLVDCVKLRAIALCTLSHLSFSVHFDQSADLLSLLI